MTSNDLALFSGLANEALAEGIARALDTSLGQRNVQRFPDGELRVELHESVRGRSPSLVDDMISTGGTIAAVVMALRRPPTHWRDGPRWPDLRANLKPSRGDLIFTLGNERGKQYPQNYHWVAN